MKGVGSEIKARDKVRTRSSSLGENYPVLLSSSSFHLPPCACFTSISFLVGELVSLHSQSLDDGTFDSIRPRECREGNTMLDRSLSQDSKSHPGSGQSLHSQPPSHDHNATSHSINFRRFNCILST
ncbi:unnamed protein product [Nesidiocoris tenuis]|uniref:Uncharacterized protein n=1 Tax=Nesidiocoris tenuis TaxID=355587 RepID=A0A6H5G5X4_9HEMI|nr:unnamed protein product [Nesidiocoris tenuis]